MSSPIAGQARSSDRRPAGSDTPAGVVTRSGVELTGPPGLQPQLRGHEQVEDGDGAAEQGVETRARPPPGAERRQVPIDAGEPGQPRHRRHDRRHRDQELGDGPMTGHLVEAIGGDRADPDRLAGEPEAFNGGQRGHDGRRRQHQEGDPKNLLPALGGSVGRWGGGRHRPAHRPGGGHPTRAEAEPTRRQGVVSLPSRAIVHDSVKVVSSSLLPSTTMVVSRFSR